MKVYLTYSRYGRGEVYHIYNLDTNLARSLKSWNKKDLPDFLSYGADDISQLYLVRCDLTKSEIQLIKDFMDSRKEYRRDVYNLMDNKIHDHYEEIRATSGSESWEILDFACKHCRTYHLYNYFQNYDLNFNDEDELKEQIWEIISTDDQLWDVVVKKYIEMYY